MTENVEPIVTGKIKVLNMIALVTCRWEDVANVLYIVTG